MKQNASKRPWDSWATLSLLTPTVSFSDHCHFEDPASKMQAQSPVVIVTQPGCGPMPQTSNWQTGMCDCFSDCGVCKCREMPPSWPTEAKAFPHSSLMVQSRFLAYYTWHVRQWMESEEKRFMTIIVTFSLAHQSVALLLKTSSGVKMIVTKLMILTMSGSGLMIISRPYIKIKEIFPV